MASTPPIPQPRPPRRKRSFLGTLGLLSFLALVLLAAALLYVRFNLNPVTDASRSLTFEVMPGWGAARIAAELEQEGLVRDATVFSLWLRYRNLDRLLGEGLYELDPAMSAPDIAARLAAGGAPRTAFVIIPEGFRATDIATRLSETNLGERQSYLELFTDAGLFEESLALEPAPDTLEGYLFPAGYEIPLGSEPETVTRLMLERFREELTEPRLERLNELGLSVADWVKLASIIQAEAAGPDEMPIIAGVFLNRLDDSMLLQSDPTVAYGLDKDLPELDVTAGDFEADHPWNTYLYAGLPATPINNPGSEALQAVLEPERQTADGDDYLFFLHGFDGDQAVFRPNTTLEAHNRDVQRFLR